MKIPVAVIGATGIAGQQFLAALEDHPLFELTRLAGSAKSAGQPYHLALRDSRGASRWHLTSPLPQKFSTLLVEDGDRFEPNNVSLVFSAVESDAALALETRFAAHVPVVSTASAFRYQDDVPLFLPGVNFDHAPLIRRQQQERHWKGFVCPIPNCTTTGLAFTLKPLLDTFGIRQVLMTSLQACSGAGRSPGVVGLDIIDNIIPFIPKEEEKVEAETKKILGQLQGTQIIPAPLRVSATCTRVPVLEGHTESVFVSLEKPASLSEVAVCFQNFNQKLTALELPSAPKQWLILHDDPFRPQPRLDRDAEGGLATSVGRLRQDTALENGIKYMLVSHNTRMGAARGAVLVAEFLSREGYLNG